MHQLAADFFLQMAVILIACRLVGLLARRIGQPQVVGEMIAGVLLGPSLFGMWFPDAAARVFTQETRGILYAGSQLGVGLYMFLVGMEFRTDHLRARARSAVSVSLAGMAAPFLLGALLAPWLIGVPGLFADTTRLHEAILFLGAAIAITAFPMLARIIRERGLAGTQLGTLALAAGAIDDAAAWCVLAVVLASFGGDGSVAITAIGGGVLYALVMLTIGRRLLDIAARHAARQGHVSQPLMALVLALFCASAWFTDTIGVHAVFGGFILGAAMPRGLLSEELGRKLEPFTVVFLLPMFFTFSGLNTTLDVLLTPSMLLIAAVVLAASTLGKGVACWAAARLHGEDQRTSIAVGALMNSRGLMELIIINIGLQHGIIGRELFAVLVIMAIVTTLMATPVFELAYGRRPRGGELTG